MISPAVIDSPEIEPGCTDNGIIKAEDERNELSKNIKYESGIWFHFISLCGI